MWSGGGRFCTPRVRACSQKEGLVARIASDDHAASASVAPPRFQSWVGGNKRRAGLKRACGVGGVMKAPENDAKQREEQRWSRQNGKASAGCRDGHDEGAGW
jgi:hypothetical protein